MPYNRERAGKGGHADLVRNPDVSTFLENCSYMREPSDQEGKSIAHLLWTHLSELDYLQR